MGKPIATPAHRDPYASYRYRLSFATSTTPVAGFARVSALWPLTALQIAGTPGHPGSPTGSGGAAGAAITLEQGLSLDPEFLQWATTPVLDPGQAGAAPGAGRRELWLDLCDEKGAVVSRLAIHGGWVSEYQAVPDLDAGGNAVLIHHLRLDHQGGTAVSAGLSP